MNSHEKNAEKKTTTNSKGDGIGIKIGMLFAFGFFVLSFVKIPTPSWLGRFVTLKPLKLRSKLLSLVTWY